MHRTLLAASTLAAIALAPISSVSAQSAQPGLLLGASFSTLTGDLIDDAETYTTFIGGGFLRFDMGSVAIEPGLFLANKGAKVDLGDGFTATNKFSYAQLPVLFKVGFPMGGATRFYLGAGPAIGFKLSCKFKASGEGISASTDCEDLEDEDENGLKAKSTEFSGIGVAGVEFGKFGIGLRADLGFTNVYEASGAGVTVEPDIKTRTISLVGTVRL